MIALIPKRFHILTGSSFDVSTRSCLPNQLLWHRFPNAIYQSVANCFGEVTFPKRSKTSGVSSMQVNINYTLGNEGCDACSVPKRFHILTESSFDVSAKSCLPNQLLWRQFPNAIYQSAANHSGEVTFPKHSKTSGVSSM